MREPELSEFEKSLDNEVSIAEPWELVEEFSTLHRPPCSEDERAAAAYIEDRFEEYGVPYERYGPEFWVAEPESVSLRVRGPEMREFTNEGLPSVKAHSFSKSRTVEGEVVQLPVHDVDNVNELLSVAGRSWIGGQRLRG